MIPLLPIGIVGVWRWLSFLFKRCIATKYSKHICDNQKTFSSAIVIPIHNENPSELYYCIESITSKAKDSEIIAVIRKPDNNSFKSCVQVLDSFSQVKVIKTDIKGKREALMIGLESSQSEIVIFVDSDVIWEFNIQNLLCPFQNSNVGGVGIVTRSKNTDTIHAKLQDVLWGYKANVTDAFLSYTTQAITCICGRTAAYRRETIDDCKYEFLNEYFLGKKLKSGDDKFFTRKILNQGLDIIFQKDCIVKSQVPHSLLKWFRQHVRWNRNCIRSDYRSLTDKNMWYYKHKLNLFLIDRYLGKAALLFGMTGVAIFLPEYTIYGIIGLALWWLISRSLKIRSSTKSDILIMPLYAILVVPFLLFVSIYAMLTVRQTGWLTR